MMFNAIRPLLRLGVIAALSFGTLLVGEVRRETNPDGSLAREVPIVDGKIDGVVRDYSSGELYRETPYVAGVIEGVVKMYGPGGILVNEVPFVSGRVEGISRSYGKNGKVISETTSNDGKTQRTRSFFESGTVSYDQPFQNGVPHGIAKRYFESGKLEAQESFENGSLEGLTISYYENGNKASETPYVRNAIHGIQRVYSESGSLEEEIPFRMGSRHGINRTFYESGEVWRVTPYWNDVVHGTVVEYDRMGNIISQEEYDAAGAPEDAEEQLKAFTSQFGPPPPPPQDPGVDSQTDRTKETSVVSTTNPQTGIKTITTIDPKGNLLSEEVYLPAGEKPISSVSFDPETGVTTSVVRSPEGDEVTTTTQTFEGQGFEKTVSTDSLGNRTETIAPNDGSPPIVTETDAEGNSRTIVSRPDGSIQISELSPEGYFTETLRDASGDTIIIRQDLDGTELERIVRSADGREIRTDAEGNRTEISRLGDNITETVTDRRGNIRTVVRDKDGVALLSMESRGTPKEPGQEYYERVLGGLDWEELPRSMQDRFANSEKQMQDAANSRKFREDLLRSHAEEDEEQRLLRESRARMTRGELDKIRAVDKAAEDEIAARDKRELELRQNFEEAEKLKKEYAAAKERGDTSEVIRLREALDDYQEASHKILQFTPEEAREDEVKDWFRIRDVASDKAASKRNAEIERRQKEIALQSARDGRARTLADNLKKAKELQREYDSALSRGDREKANRLREELDLHHDASHELLQFTAEEAEEADRKAELRHKLSQEIIKNARAEALAQGDQDWQQDLKEAVTRGTKWVSIGSERQQETKDSTRMANFEKAFAEGKMRRIQERLRDPSLTEEERDILRDMLDIAAVQAHGAAKQLESNIDLATAGYAVDAAMLGSGAIMSAAGGATGKLANWGASKLTRWQKVKLARLERLGSMEVIDATQKGILAATSRVAGKEAAEQLAAHARSAVEAAKNAAGKVFEMAEGTATRAVGEEAMMKVRVAAAKARDVLSTDVRTGQIGESVLLKEKIAAAKVDAVIDASAQFVMTGHVDLEETLYGTLGGAMMPGGGGGPEHQNPVHIRLRPEELVPTNGGNVKRSRKPVSSQGSDLTPGGQPTSTGTRTTGSTGPGTPGTHDNTASAGGGGRDPSTPSGGGNQTIKPKPGELKDASGRDTGGSSDGQTPGPNSTDSSQKTHPKPTDLVGGGTGTVDRPGGNRDTRNGPNEPRSRNSQPKADPTGGEAGGGQVITDSQAPVSSPGGAEGGPLKTEVLANPDEVARDALRHRPLQERELKGIRFKRGNEEYVIGDFIAGGSFNHIYRLESHPGKVIRVSIRGGESVATRFDLAGRQLLDGTRDRLEGRVEFYRAETLTDFNPGQEVGGDRVAMIMDESSLPSAGKLFSENPRRQPTVGQSIAYDRAMRALNQEGLVMLDSHTGNFSFRKIGEPDEWILVITDTGGIVPTKGRSPELARQIQRLIDNPERTFDPRFVESLGRRPDVQILEKVGSMIPLLERNLDYQAMGMTGLDEILSPMIFNANGAEDFVDARFLNSVPDAEVEAAYRLLREKGGFAERYDYLAQEPPMIVHYAGDRTVNFDDLARRIPLKEYPSLKDGVRVDVGERGIPVLQPVLAGSGGESAKVARPGFYDEVLGPGSGLSRPEGSLRERALSADPRQSAEARQALAQFLGAENVPPWPELAKTITSEEPELAGRLLELRSWVWDQLKARYGDKIKATGSSGKFSNDLDFSNLSEKPGRQLLDVDNFLAREIDLGGGVRGFGRNWRQKLNMDTFLDPQLIHIYDKVTDPVARAGILHDPVLFKKGDLIALEQIYHNMPPEAFDEFIRTVLPEHPELDHSNFEAFLDKNLGPRATRQEVLPGIDDALARFSATGDPAAARQIVDLQMQLNRITEDAYPSPGAVKHILTINEGMFPIPDGTKFELPSGRSIESLNGGAAPVQAGEIKRLAKALDSATVSDRATSADAAYLAGKFAELQEHVPVDPVERYQNIVSNIAYFEHQVHNAGGNPLVAIQRYQASKYEARVLGNVKGLEGPKPPAGGLVSGVEAVMNRFYSKRADDIRRYFGLEGQALSAAERAALEGEAAAFLEEIRAANYTLARRARKEAMNAVEPGAKELRLGDNDDGSVSDRGETIQPPPGWKPEDPKGGNRGVTESAEPAQKPNLEGKTMSVTQGGKTIELRLGKKIGEGSFNQVYLLESPAGKVVRVSIGSSDSTPVVLDYKGRELLERSRDALAGRLEFVEAETFTSVQMADASPGGVTVSIMGNIELRADRQLAANPGFRPTAGQSIAYERGIRALNRQGLVILDGHLGNYYFRPTGNPDEWIMVIIDPGGIVPVRNRDPYAAREVQRLVDDPPNRAAGSERDKFYDVRKAFEMEPALAQAVDLQELGLRDIKELTQGGPFGAPLFKPRGAEDFTEVRELFRLSDDEVEAAYEALRRREKGLGP